MLMRAARQSLGNVSQGGGLMKKKKNEPHGKRFGWLKNGNLPCDLRSLPKCEAKAQSNGKRCGNLLIKVTVS